VRGEGVFVGELEGILMGLRYLLKELEAISKRATGTIFSVLAFL
jgi:hypothetical protein